MKLHVIFGQRVCQYEGQYAPEVIDCWDEYSLEDAHDIWDECVINAQARATGKDPEFTRVLVVEIKVDGDKIVNLLNKNPIINGEV